MELLSLDRVSREDDFFALGGDSLMLGPMMIAVERRVGVRLTLAELFGASALHALAAHLEHLRQRQADTQRVRRHLPRTGPDVDARFDQLRAHGRLDPAWQLERAPEPQPERLQEVLITGVTGFVGA
ncbi:MAG: phosphopantetheine-binding protein, partial [bacterium]